MCVFQLWASRQSRTLDTQKELTAEELKIVFCGLFTSAVRPTACTVVLVFAAMNPGFLFWLQADPIANPGRLNMTQACTVQEAMRDR